MAGRGPAPKVNARRRNAPAWEWRAAPGVGWQHGPIPEAPDGLLEASQTAWETWMRGWFAAHWTPGDLPGLRVVIRLYDAVERGRYGLAGELRLWLDTFGASPKGAMDRRWRRPEVAEPPQKAPRDSYRHLKVVEDSPA